MWNEERIRDGLERRLSGLGASAERRARIRDAVATCQKEERMMKRKLSMALVAALALVAIAAAVAVAEGLNLFQLFGQRDERYAKVAQEAALETVQPVQVEDERLGEVQAAIDGAYFDGLTLSVAFRIDNAAGCEAYTPTAEELAGMERTDAMFAAVMQDEPGAEIIAAFNEAAAAGQPGGYRRYSLSAGDQTRTDDGIDIPPSQADGRYTADGAYCEMRDFATPLPEAIRDRESLTLCIPLYRFETTVYFDGESWYMRTEREDAGAITAEVGRAQAQAQRMSGQAHIGGATCTAEAEVSAMSAVLTVRSDMPLDNLLAAPPEGTAPADCWVMADVYDDDGAMWRVQEVNAEEAQVTFILEGAGSLPDALEVYLYAAWEGGEPDLSGVEPIELTR